MNKQEIDAFLKIKEQRQELLNKRKEKLVVLDKELFSSRLGRYLGTTYLWVKQLLSLVIGIGIILFAFSLFTSLYEDTSIEKLLDLFTVVKTVAFLIFLGVVFLYISRMTRNIRRRNVKLSKSESLTREIISDYVKTIEEEKMELQLFKELSNNL